jgi:hypothetical protein
MEKARVLVGKMLSNPVAVESASTQYEGGMDAWNSRERTTLLIDRMMRSALPF